MIGKLRGTVDTINDDSVIIDVNGVGYLVFSSTQTLRALPHEGLTTSLIIETHVREDHIHLYGFLTNEEKEWFKILLTVQGIGTRLALAILSTLNTQQISSAIVSQDKKSFTQISGVGPKLADRILTELKNKVVIPSSAFSDGKFSSLATAGNSTESDAARNAVSALTNLGYKSSDAFTIVNRLIQQNKNQTMEELIRNSLRELVI